jgi:hypothetical protein
MLPISPPGGKLALLPLAAWAQEAEDAALDAGLEIVEAPAIELVIVGPGEDFTTLYGHAAMRVVDDPSRPETARVFNFGITAFDNPDLTREFIGGRVVFWGDVGPYDATLAGWKRDDRTVTRYPVLLGDGARRRLLARLEHDVAPAHRQYIYDTFRENCATRLRDVLDTYSGGTVFATHGGVDGGRAFRQDVREAYSNRSGLLLATELMAGADTDRPRTAWELMYRPEYMAERLVEVVLPGGKPLLGAPAVDHTRQGADPRSGSPHHGQVFWGALAVLAGLLGWWIRGRGPRVRGGVLAVAALLSSLIGGVDAVGGPHLGLARNAKESEYFGVRAPRSGAAVAGRTAAAGGLRLGAHRAALAHRSAGGGRRAGGADPPARPPGRSAAAPAAGGGPHIPRAAVS